MWTNIYIYSIVKIQSRVFRNVINVKTGNNNNDNSIIDTDECRWSFTYFEGILRALNVLIKWLKEQRTYSSTRQTDSTGWNVFTQIWTKTNHMSTKTKIFIKCLVFVKSKCWKLGGGIQRFLLLGTIFIGFRLSIFIFHTSSSSSPSFCSFPLLQICRVSSLAFCSFRPRLKERKRTWNAHVNYRTGEKQNCIVLLCLSRLQTPTWWRLNAHTDTQACSLKLHPVMYNHYWQAASLWPAGSSPPRAFIYLFFFPSFSQTKGSAFLDVMELGWIIRPGEWTGNSTGHTHTHTNKNPHIHSSPPAPDEAPPLTPCIFKQANTHKQHHYRAGRWYKLWRLAIHCHFIVFGQNSVIRSNSHTQPQGQTLKQGFRLNVPLQGRCPGFLITSSQLKCTANCKSKPLKLNSIWIIKIICYHIRQMSLLHITHYKKEFYLVRPLACIWLTNAAPHNEQW